jgi:hypothetical protein
MLSGTDASLLAERPASGKWSVVENLRHLLFAEQLHLGRFAPDGIEFSPLALPPAGMQGSKRLGVAGSAAAATVDQVMEAWRALRVSTLHLAKQDTPEVRNALARHLPHLRAHVNVIARLLRSM